MNISEYAKFKKIFGGSGGATSWNDLEDKPFYNEPGVEIMPETQLEDYGAGFVAVTVFGCPDFVVGKTYTVNLDGTPYSCVAWDSGEGVVCLGNTYAFGGEDTGEPFVALHFPAGAYEGSDQDGIVVQILDSILDSSEIYRGKIVSIYTAETIKPLDEKYMPILTSPNGSKFKLTVTDEGAIIGTKI